MKFKLSGALSIILSIALVIAGLCIGTVRGFNKERSSVTGLLENESGLMDVLSYRGADGLNLYQVASRHLQPCPEMEALKATATGLTSGSGTLEQLKQLDTTLDTDAANVIALLEASESYQSSQRDQRYVGMLQRDMQGLSNQSFYTEYTTAAEEFNHKLENDLLGKFAALLGVKPCTMDITLSAGEKNLRFPENKGVVTDDADVLDPRTIEDMEEYADMVEDETDVDIYVAMVHFTDGLDVQTYARTLFEKWELDEDDLLIVGAAGQDAFAMEMGSDVKKKVGSSGADNLFYTSTGFSALFADQKYDQSFASLFTGMTELFNKEYREDMKMGKLFDHTTDITTGSSDLFGSATWQNALGGIPSVQDMFEEESSNGLTAVHWILLAAILMIIINGSQPVRKKKNQWRRNHR